MNYAGVNPQFPKQSSPVPAPGAFTSPALALSLHCKLAEGSDLAGNYFVGGARGERGEKHFQRSFPRSACCATAQAPVSPREEERNMPATGKWAMLPFLAEHCFRLLNRIVRPQH